MPEVLLAVNGKQYGGWQSVDIRRGIEQISGTFALTLTERWSGQDEPWPIEKGDACQVLIDKEPVITGYVDDTIPTFDATQHSISVIGRDKTGDLVDCSAIVKSGEWKGRNLLQIATDLAKPFGIKVIADTDYGKTFSRFSIQEGETCFEALDRAARMRGVLLVSDGQGGLLITRAGKVRIATALVQGENILAGGGTFSMRDRYSKYICKGQNYGHDNSTPDHNSGPKGEAADANVLRYRPLLVIAEDIADAKGLKDRAMWEAVVRMGRSARPTVTAQGWHHTDGLWLPNRLVPVRCPYLKIDREMLIAAVNYRIDDKGTRTIFELCLPAAFELLAVPAHVKKSERSLW